jgi:hypothetical protein
MYSYTKYVSFNENMCRLGEAGVPAGVRGGAGRGAFYSDSAGVCVCVCVCMCVGGAGRGAFYSDTAGRYIEHRV